MKYQKIGLVGHPLGHTMSPYIHENLFALSRIKHAYNVLDITELPSVIPALRNLNGFNITIPYKEQIIHFLDDLDDQALFCGSVNTVLCRDDRMTGYTTDGIGCVKALRDAGVSVGGRILLLGNGGAARALGFAIAGLKEIEAITIACRDASRQKAEELVLELENGMRERRKSTEIRTCVYGALCKTESKYDMLLNTTSVGMYPDVDKSPVEEEVLRRCSVVFDAVYNPIETKLLRTAKALGIQTVNGMGMLVYQAAAAHEIWYGASFRADDLAELCKAAERELAKCLNG